MTSPTDPQSQRFRPHERINDPEVFKKAFEARKSVSDPGLIVFGVPNGLTYPRLGISASKRRLRKAHDRNRFKRIVREAFRLSKSQLPAGVDLIVVPRHDKLQLRDALVSFPQLARSAARRAGIPPQGRP